MRMVRAILIDPFECKVTEIEHDASDYHKIYEVLSHPSMKVSTFDVVYPGLASRDCIYVDDEGLLKLTERFFVINNYPNALAGKGLILGSDIEGETVSAETQLNDMKITFLERSGKGLLPVAEPWHKTEVSADLTSNTPVS